MKAFKLTGIRQMQMMEVPDPVIAEDTDVLIRMKSLGVCGSDIHYYTTGRIGKQVVQYPFTVGHEGAGQVEAVGRAVKSLKAGDRIAIEPAMPCWQCDQCISGRPHTCLRLRFLGCPGQAEGCLSEYIVMPETSCFKISNSLTYDQAAIIEPLSIGVYAVNQSVLLKGASMGIFGFGPIGMSVFMAARNRGAGKIFVTDRIKERLMIADREGALMTANPDREDIVCKISEENPGLLDAVFECCGQQEATNQAVELLKPGGKLMIIGIPEFERWSFDVDNLRRKEICIQNVRRQNNSVEEAHDLITGGPTKLDSMITHHFAFADACVAFDLVANYEDGVMKAMIHFD
jgi:L-iditol 2-dehydrogenase